MLGKTTFFYALVLAFTASLWPVMGADWPEYMGPHGNLSSVTPGVQLETDPSKYKLVWSSEETGMGYGKNWSGYPQPNLTAERALPGGLSSPIYAGGAVYIHYFHPKPGATASNYVNYRKPAIPPQGATNADDHPHYRILADDIDVAIDAATGRTLWRHAGDEPGINLYTTKRNGWGVTSCVHSGRYFSMNTLGEVLAFEAKTGKRLWKSGDPAWCRKLRDQAVQEKTFVRGPCLRGHLAVIGGLLIAPGYGVGLQALDPATGAVRWSWKGPVTGFAAGGYRATVAGQELILVPGGNGVTCLDPQTGRVRWQVDGGAQVDYALTVHEDRFLIQDTDGKPYAEANRTHNARWALYRALPDKAERVWRSSVMGWIGRDAGPQQRPPMDGRMAFLSHMEADPLFTVLDLTTGAVIRQYAAKDGGDKMTIGLCVENIIVSRSESDNDGRYGVWILDAPRPEAFKHWASLKNYHYCYQSVALAAYGNGFLFVRSIEKGGCIQGWDLRPGK
jgi:outer membrane protein assembly factor BamB